MTSLLEQSINTIIEYYSYFFFSKENVLGVGLGFKNIKGLNTNEPCIHVLVENKKNLNNLFEKDKIPKAFLGIKTDVIKIGSLIEFNSIPINPSFPNIIENNLFQTRIRPIKPGYSIGPIGRKLYGTLGAIVFHNKDNKPYILSNNHILANNNKIPKGRPILQPGAYNGGSILTNRIGELYSFLEINYTDKHESSNKHYNYADCAISTIDDNIKYSNEFDEIGIIKGIAKEKVGITVQKLGATTGKTLGNITTINANISYKDAKGYNKSYKNLIITTYMASAGDSGSLLVTLDKKAVGLLISGTDKINFFSPIKYIMNYFNMHF